MHKRSLPIAYSCGQRWDELTPEGNGRHCAECSTTVVDLSSMTERAARRLIARGEVTCVRYRSSADGEVSFRAEPPRRGLERLAAGLGVAAILGSAAPARADASLPSPGPSQTGRQLTDAARSAVTAPTRAAASTHATAPHRAARPAAPPRHEDDEALGLLMPSF